MTNEKEGTVAVRFTPKIDKEVTISNVINSVTNYKFETAKTAEDAVDGSDNLTGVNVNCLPVEDYLDVSMQSLFGNSFDSFIKLSKNSSNISYFRGYDNWISPSTGYVIVDPADLPLPFTNETIQEPKELSTTANVSLHQVQNGAQVNTYYYVEASNILNEFPVGTAIGWFDNNSNDINGPKRIIRGFSSTSNIVVAGGINNVDPGFNLPDTPPVQIVTNGRIFAYDSNLNQVANDSIKELAGIEGSIYGTGFSKNFYVHRLSDNDTEYITLKYDLVSDIKQKKLNKYLQDVVVRQVADYENENIPNFGQIPKVEGQEDPFRMPNLKGAGAFVRGNENATKSLEINLAPVYPFLNKATKTGTRFVNLTDDTAILERAITSAGALSYAQSLNQQSGGAKIEFTYLDALALKPYEVFQFDSTASEKYQNKQYRITSIAYDFVKNEIKVVGYQISDLATPVVREPGPGEEIPKPVQPPSGAEVTYNVGWNMISNPTTTNSLGFGTVFGEDIVKGTTYLYTGSYEVASFMQAPTFGKGYWVYFKDEAFGTETERDYEYPGEIFDSNVTIDVAQGWNLIPSLGVPTYPVSNTANILAGTIFEFNGTYVQKNVLQPGKGYWVNVDQAGDIKLNNEGVPVNPVNLNQEFRRADIATGSATQSVFFDGTNSNTNVNIQQAFLPPPIGSTFDVRINQDETNTALRDLRAVESNTINIDVQQIDSATTLNISPSIFYYVSGAVDASPSHTTNVYTSLSGYSLACSCSIYETGSLYYTTGPAPLENFQATFLDGDKIITAQNIVENSPVDVPITTTRIQLKPMGADIKLPVRARDIANDDGEILDTVAIAGSTGAVGDRIQYLNSSGELTELRTAGVADFIQTVVSRPEFSSKQNNVPSKGQVLLMSYDGTGGLTDNEISGFTAGTAGKLLRVINVGSNSIRLSANDTGSSAGNRILGSDVLLGQYESATLMYVEDYVDGFSTTTIDAWILISNT